jgi:aspartyl/glutamyl-tRNA(Asn/Gln) amidotransferase C subunit
MEINDIKKLGELAKIEINEAEAEGFKKDFESILGYIKQIESVDLSAQAGLGDVTPSYGTQNVTRIDVAKNVAGEYSESLLASAPNTENGFIKVKKIL